MTYVMMLGHLLQLPALYTGLLMVVMLVMLVMVLMVVLMAVEQLPAKQCEFPGPRYLLGLGPLVTWVRFLLMGIGGATQYYSRRYGPRVRVWIFGDTTLILSDPELAHEALKSSGLWSRFGSEPGLAAVGMGPRGLIFNSHAESWARLRPYFMNALTGPSLARLVEVTLQSTVEHLEALRPDHQRRQQRWTSGRVDALKLMRMITLDSSNRAFLGVSLNEEEVVSRIRSYFSAWESLMLKPDWWFRVPGLTRTQRRHGRELQQEVSRLVQLKRRQLHEQHTLPPRPDFTSCLLLAQERGEVSEEEVTQCVLEMMIAGPDTMSVTLLYMLLTLGERPRIEAQLRAEIRDVLGTRRPTLRELQVSLPQLERFVSESLRQRPVVDVIMRRCGPRGASLAGRPLAPHTNVIVDLRALHSSHAGYPRPDEFHMDNFAAPVAPRFFQPFGSGPRACAGKLAAGVVMKAVLVALLSGYGLRTAGAERPLATSDGLSLHPLEEQAGLMIVFERRGGGGGDGGGGDDRGDGKSD